MLTSELLNCICRFGRRKKTISLRQTVWLRQLASSESHTCRRWVKQGSEVTTRPKRFLRRFQLRRQNSDRFWRRFPSLSPSVLLLVSLVIRVTNVTIMITMVINSIITMLIMTKIPIWKRALYSSNYARPDCCQWICYLNFVQPQPPNQLFRDKASNQDWQVCTFWVLTKAKELVTAHSADANIVRSSFESKISFAPSRLIVPFIWVTTDLKSPNLTRKCALFGSTLTNKAHYLVKFGPSTCFIWVKFDLQSGLACFAYISIHSL